MPFYASICQVMCVSVSVLCVSAFLKACTLIVHVYVCKALRDRLKLRKGGI